MISLTAHSPPKIRESKHPLSLNETRNTSNDKGVTSQPKHPNTLKVITMHSDSESTLISPRADKFGSTLPPLDKRAQDKNEGGEEDTIPPPLFKRNPEDNEEGDWRQFSDPATLAKISAIKTRAAQAISSSAHLGGAKPKQIIESKHPRVPSYHSTQIMESKHPRVPSHHSTRIRESKHPRVPSRRARKR